MNVLARETGAQLVVVDAGVAAPVEHEAIRQLRLGAGTADATEGPAMTPDQALAGLRGGGDRRWKLAAGGSGIVATGDMGIGNTTAAAALCAALLPADSEAVSGRGTGLDDAGLARRSRPCVCAHGQRGGRGRSRWRARVRGWLRACGPGRRLPRRGRRGCVVLLDGFVTGAAALVAARLAPAAAGFMVASHRSPEPGHGLVLTDLGLRPLLDLGLAGGGAARCSPCSCTRRWRSSPTWPRSTPRASRMPAQPPRRRGG